MVVDVGVVVGVGVVDDGNVDCGSESPLVPSNTYTGLNGRPKTQELEWRG